MGFHTSADIFIVIIMAYLGFTLAMGARQLYFGKFAGKEEEESKPSTDAAEQK